MRVLIAEDDAALAMFLERGLETEGYSIDWVVDGDKAIDAALANAPDLLVLDLNLPIKDGFQVLSALQKIEPSIPTLILSGRTSVEDRVACLDLGADDYLLKPFSLHELLARCRAIQRRRGAVASAVIVHGDLCLNRLNRTVERAGIMVELTKKEQAMLSYFMQNRGRVLDRGELLAEVFQLSPETQTNVVEVYISYLRTKIKVRPTSLPLIETVRGQGYTVRLEKFIASDRPASSLDMPETIWRELE